VTSQYRIDLFSDTNCHLSKGMRDYMMKADVGNEVAGEDPTVNLLLERTCDLLGKEAAVFMPSGTMCNGVSFRVLCKRAGDTIVLDKTAHALHKASGLIPGLVHANPQLIDGKRGIFTLEQVKSVLENPDGYNVSKPRVISIEQITNFGGGAIWPIQTLIDICDYAHKKELNTHMDGARLFNAVIASGVSAAEYAKPFDAVWIDFCKGLGSPMGAVLAGSKAFIEEAWYYKFQQGGGLHKAGILAAACLYGLDNNLPRLQEVHQKTKELSKLLSQIDGIHLNPDDTECNIILLEIVHPRLQASIVEQKLKNFGIRTLAVSSTTLRIICHMDITEKDIQEVYAKISYILETPDNV